VSAWRQSNPTKFLFQIFVFPLGKLWTFHLLLPTDKVFWFNSSLRVLPTHWINLSLVIRLCKVSEVDSDSLHNPWDPLCQRQSALGVNIMQCAVLNKVKWIFRYLWCEALHRKNVQHMPVSGLAEWPQRLGSLWGRCVWPDVLNRTKERG